MVQSGTFGMNTFITVLQIILSVLLIVCIILQAKGTGLGSSFGGVGGGGSVYSSRRGLERAVFIATIVIASLFLVSSIIGVRIS